MFVMSKIICHLSNKLNSIISNKNQYLKYGIINKKSTPISLARLKYEYLEKKVTDDKIFNNVRDKTDRETRNATIIV